MADEEEVKEEKKGGGKGLIIVLLVVIILLLVGMGAMAFLLLGGDKSAEEGGETTEVHASAEHGNGEDVPASEFSNAKEYSPKYKQFEPPPPETPPMYFTMDKFVVNFNGNGQAKFLAVDLKFMSYYAQVVGDTGEMENLRPILKNDIERLLRNQQYNDLILADGPDKLREQILEVARKVLEKHNIYPDLVDDVYMTRFVMQ